MPRTAAQISQGRGDFRPHASRRELTLRADLGGEHRAGEILVDHRGDALQIAFAIARDRNAAATRGNRNDIGGKERFDRGESRIRRRMSATESL